jgi:hypothetical protein
MRALQRGTAAGGKRSYDVSVRLAHSDKGAEENNEVLFDGLVARLRQNETCAAMEILERIKTLQLVSVEALLDPSVTEACGERGRITAKGHGCMLRSKDGHSRLQVDLLIEARAMGKGKKRKKM